MNAVDRFFQISKRDSNVRTEVVAGITTFVTMAYILPVNMNILGDAGLDSGGVFMATALAAVVGTMLMGLLAGLPFAQAPGMGLNAFFAYTVVGAMGFSPGFALAAVFVEGLIFILLSVTGFRTKLLNAIPEQLRLPIGAGIGFFIMFIGLQNAGIVVANPSTLVEITSNLTSAAVALAIIGLAITVTLWLKKVKGALLIGILITWILGMFAQAGGWYIINPEVGAYSLIPNGVFSDPSSMIESMSKTVGLCFTGMADAFASPAAIGSFILVTITFLYVDIFDTLGTFTGVMTKAELIDRDGEFPGADKAFLSDAVATTFGAVMGTSTVTTYVESAAGVSAGGRTGLTAVVTAICFALAIPFFPLISAIPGFATAPALVAVGIMMCEPMWKFEWQNLEVVIPGVIAMVMMVVGYSISAGIMWGVLFFILVKAVKGKFYEVKPMMWVLGALFIVKLFFLA